MEMGSKGSGLDSCSSECSLPDHFIVHKDSMMTIVLGKTATPSFKEATAIIVTPCSTQPIKKEEKKEKARPIRNFFSKLFRCKRNGRDIALEKTTETSDPSFP